MIHSRQNLSLLSTLAAMLGFMFSALPAAASITRDGSVSWLRSAAPGTFDVSGSDKLVVVISGEHNFANNLTGNCTGVTYNGQALTLAIKQMPADPATGGHGQTHSSIWYLDDPGDFPGSNNIVITCVGTSWVATAIGLSGTQPGVGPTAKISGAAAVGLTTDTYSSLVIAAVGMGGQGNTATPLPGVSATSPSQADTISGLKIGSNWAGHAVASAEISMPSLQTFTFNSAKTDLVTVAAAFSSANPEVPEGPTPVVHDIVPGESVELVWSNLLPNVGSDVWVDVLIGSAPSNLQPVIDADPDGINLTSIIYDAPAPGIYHGRIDSYLQGSPTGTPLTGTAFSFEVSATGLRAESWLGLRPLASLLVLQREGIAARPPNHSLRHHSALLENLAAPGGVRLRGLFTPEVTGLHSFHIAGSENTALWLSSNDSRFLKQRIAWQLESTGTGQWNKFPTQTSAPIQLHAGIAYYIEAQVMTSVGIGHLAIGWTPPGATTPALIPAARLTYLPADPADSNDNNLPDLWEEDTELDVFSLPGTPSEYGDADRDGIQNFDEFRSDSNPLEIGELVNGLTRETWTSPGVSGAPITSLTSSPRFNDHPSEIVHVPGINDANRGTQYGARYRGFLIAPETGSYRFWITGNDEVQLWLADGTITPHGESEPRRDRFGKRLIARNEYIINNYAWPTWNNFDHTPAQRSQVINLVEGQSYYIEVLHKQGWGAGDDHVSLAWQPPGQAREIIPATAFVADIPNDEDPDDDNLPDDWQDDPENGLADAALTAFQRGQFGDPDGDGLINLLEYQYGTLPRDADTDNDGISDYAEIFHYGTDPRFNNNILGGVLNDIFTPHQYVSSATSGGWTANPDGSLSAWDQRGEITYSFTLETPGVHEIILTGAAIGTVRPTERLPIVLSLNGQEPFAREELVSINGGQGTVRGITTWLAAGTHTLNILHDNYLAARQLRIDSIAISRLGGQDLENNLIPDWIEQNAAELNALTRVPTHSRTSPVSIEGITQNISTAPLQYTPPGGSATPLVLNPSINDTFFTDVPLSENGATALDGGFLSGLVPATASIEWIPTNLFDTFIDDTLHIRQGDSLRLDAWSGTASDSEPFTVTLNGTPVADAADNTTHSSGSPFSVEFGTTGTFTLVASHGGQTNTVTLRVHSADFGANLSVRAFTNRSWSPPTLDASHLVEADERVILAETTANPETGPRTFKANVNQAGNRHVIARLPADIDGAPSAILARGTVHGFYLAYLDQTADAKIIQQYDDGTWLMSGTIIAVNLPPDILIRLMAHQQGTVFHNGSNILWLDSTDFDANGIATIYYEWSGTGEPKLCNRLQLFVQP